MSFGLAVRRLINAGRKATDDISKDVFRTMLEQSADVICHIADGRFLYLSPSAVHVFGWDRQYLIGKDAMRLVYEDDRPAIQDIVDRVLSGQHYPSSVQCRHICGDGSLKWCETSASVERDDSGAHRGVLVMRDISARKELEIELDL
jgi:PAS domain S-box-containing protein